MKLSSEIIVEYLKDDFTFSAAGKITKALTYTRPVFWEESTVPSDGSVYLVEQCIPEPASAVQTHCILVTIGDSLRGWAGACDLVLTFKKGTSFSRMANALHQIFTLYDEWDKELSSILNRNGQITELLDCTQKVTPNPIMVHNPAFEIISYSSIIDSNPDIGYLIDRDRNKETYNAFQLDREFKSTFSQTKPAFFPETVSGTKSLYQNLFNHGKFIGRIVIMGALEDFHRRDLQILQHLTPYIQTILSHEQYGRLEGETYSLNQLIGRILKGDVTEDSYIRQSMAAFGWQNNHHYFCSVFLADPIDVQNHTIASICRRLENQVPASCVVEHSNQIVMFFNLDLNRNTLRDVVHSYTELVRDSNLKAGISKSYEGFHLSFQLLEKQASIALSLGQRYFPERWIHHFNDISNRYQLELLVSELPTEMICSPEILKMYQYDQENNTEYYLTLKTYLENNMQPVVTASRLFVHRTTLMYRLNKINQLFHIDISTAYNRLFLQVSMLLLDQMLLNG